MALPSIKGELWYCTGNSDTQLQFSFCLDALQNSKILNSHIGEGACSKVVALASIPLLRNYVSETVSVAAKSAYNLGPVALRPLVPVIAFFLIRHMSKGSANGVSQRWLAKKAGRKRHIEL
eukprot:Skav231037  [mRNA]  locus=scaffold446:23874:27510:+ [translate_table: standard]